MGPRAGGYKEEPAPVAGDPHHPHQAQQGPSLPLHLQHPRSSHPNSPHQPQNQHPSAFPSPHSSTHGVPIQHHSPYGPSGPSPNGHPGPEVAYYSHPSSYAAPAPGPYSAPEGSEMMTAAHMQRPYQPVYGTPQSNSPASVTSSQGHDQHGRIYGQPPQQLPQGIYGYPQYPPMNQVHPSAYAQHQAQAQQQHPSLNSQHLLMSHQGQAPLQHQPQTPTSAMTNSPRPKIERPSDIMTIQRPPSGTITSNLNTPTGPPTNGNGPQQNPPGSAGTNPNAAPGPIPATTPLVVRQDNNGVQWIAFEYSRDRVKMEYTIRCDVESVDHNQLSNDFKTDNCVYPRACCQKDQYRGNRLVYETECNTVGWALADLNPCLRGKRGLIQRAVDSWRNSNQDPRLRSRRVRRMAKISNRKSAAPPTPSHLAGPGGPGSTTAPPPSANPMAAPAPRPHPGGNGVGPHHTHPDSSGQNSSEEVSANGDYDEKRKPIVKSHPSNPNSSIRQSHTFHGYPNFPSDGAVGASIAPHLQDGMGSLGAHGGPNHTAVAAAVPTTEEEECNNALFRDLPEAKRRKFILVEDPSKHGTKVRVRVSLEGAEVGGMPDSSRQINSVYPRSFFPKGMPTQAAPSRRNRFFDIDDAEAGSKYDRHVTKGRTLVPIPVMDGDDREVPVPRIARGKQYKERLLNDLGYRMAWGQLPVFHSKKIFLQKALDAYRNKMTSTMRENESEVSTLAPYEYLETRVGKRIWSERNRIPKRESSP